MFDSSSMVNVYEEEAYLNEGFVFRVSMNSDVLFIDSLFENINTTFFETRFSSVLFANSQFLRIKSFDQPIKLYANYDVRVVDSAFEEIMSGNAISAVKIEKSSVLEIS